MSTRTAWRSRANPAINVVSSAARATAVIQPPGGSDPLSYRAGCSRSWGPPVGDVWSRVAAEAPPDHAAGGGRVKVETSTGDVVDRITILDLKVARFADAGKRGNAAREREVLLAAWD